MARSIVTIFIAGCLCLLAPAPGAVAESATAAQSEYDVKAAFVYNFLKYMSLTGRPQQGHASFVICIYGAAAVTNKFNVLEGKTASERPLTVVSNPGDIKKANCDVVFFSASQAESIKSTMPVLANTGTLTIGEGENFCEDGGAVEFYNEEGKVRFEINLDSAQREKINISSKLLQLAKVMRTPTAS